MRSDGVTKWEWKPVTHKVTSAYVAANMVEVMRGVVEAGTATAVKGNRELGKRPLAGKTGTVNDFTDAWFIGYSPSYACGVWIGYPGSKRSLGEKETGGHAALPMWIDFMEDFLKGKPVEKFPEKPPPDSATLAEQERRKAEIAAAARERAEAAAEAASEDTGLDDIKEAGEGVPPQPVIVEVPDRPRPKADDDDDDDDEQREREKREKEREKKEREKKEKKDDDDKPKKRGKNE